jgi:hypothetical protein
MFIPGDIIMPALRAGGRRRLGRVFFGRFVHQSIPVTTSYLKNKKMSFMALKIPIKLSIFCPGSIFEIAFIIKVSGIFPVSKVVTCRLNSYSSSGTLYPEDAARVRAESCPRKGGALPTQGRSPAHARAEPCPRKGGALPTQGRSPAHARAEPWLHEGSCPCLAGQLARSCG